MLMADPNEAAAAPADLNHVLVLYEPADPLPAEQEDGGTLLQALRNADGYQLTSTGWLVKTARSATEVFHSLSRLTMPGDTLVVADVRGVGTQGIEDGHILFEELIRRSRGPAQPDER